jgi:glycosyltransferase involved in cell wall biosynthesis
MYNAGGTIVRCLNSIVDQTFGTVVEIVIVNDGSSDNCKSIVENYITSNPDVKINLVNKKNGGASSARNAGLNCSKGDYILFLDSDDTFVSNSISYVTDAITSNKFDIACFGFEFFDDNNKSLLKFSYDKVIKIEDFKDDFLTNGTVKNVLWNKIYSRQFLLDNDIKFRSNFEPNEDSLFVFEILLKTTKIIFLNKILYNHISDNKESYTNKFHNFHYTNALSLLEFYKEVIQKELNESYNKSYEIFCTRVLCRLVLVSTFSTPSKLDFYDNLKTIYLSNIWNGLLVSKILPLKFKLAVRFFNVRYLVWYLVRIMKKINFKMQ